MQTNDSTKLPKRLTRNQRLAKQVDQLATAIGANLQLSRVNGRYVIERVVNEHGGVSELSQYLTIGEMESAVYLALESVWFQKRNY